MKKQVIGAFLTACMAVSMAFPSMAYNERGMLDSTEIRNGIEDGWHWASGKYEAFPGWHWINGYCYYLQTPVGKKLVNCTTPDGYTVDEEGRWTVDGVPQYNGYGNLVVGTDTLYAGKNDDERWQVMREGLKKLYAEKIPGNEMFYAMSSTPDGVRGVVGGMAASSFHVIHNSYEGYLYASFVNRWNDSPEKYMTNRSEVMEQTLRYLCGDHVGGELFEDIRKAAEPAEGPSLRLPVYGEDNEPIFIDSTTVETYWSETSGDGVNFNYFDLNKWNGRMTDYGKTIEIRPTDSETDLWIIIIH